MDGTTPSIGHNSEAQTLVRIDLDRLRAGLEDEYVLLRARCVEQEAALERFKARYGNGLTDEESAGRAADWSKQIAADAKAVEDARRREKQPALEATRLIDSFFGEISEAYSMVRGKVGNALTVYAKQKADAERQARLEEARRQQEEAARLAAQAEVAPTAETLTAAVEAEQRAIDTAADAVAARPAELSRTRGDFGSVTSLRTRLTWEATDFKALVAAVAAGNAPLDALAPDKTMLDALLKKHADRLRDELHNNGWAVLLPGIAAVETAKAVVR